MLDVLFCKYAMASRLRSIVFFFSLYHHFVSSDKNTRENLHLNAQILKETKAFGIWDNFSREK